MDCPELARQTVDALRPCLTSGAAAVAQASTEATGLQAVRLYEWLKSKLVRPGAAASLADAAEKPTPGRIDALRAQILMLIEEDASFRRELETLLPRPFGPRQSVRSEGPGNVIVQVEGSGAVIHASGGYHATPPPAASTMPPATSIPRPPPGAMPPGRHDVFLCHNGRDKPEVTRLAERLLELGISPWLDVWAMRRDQPFQPQIEAALESIPSLIVFVGPNGTGPWQEQEMRAAMEEFVRRQRGIMVVLLAGAPDSPELPLLLRGFPRVDLRTWSNAGEPGVRELVAGIFGVAPEDIGGRLTAASVAALRARRA